MFEWFRKNENKNVKNTEERKDYLKKIIEIIDLGENVFITGGAGTGKSYTLSKLKKHYKDELQLTSTTGISALNIKGQTLHSWSGIGLGEKPIAVTVKMITQKPTLYKQLLLCKKLAIDEISMLDNHTMDYVNEVLKLVRENEKPFGGIQVILIGDFFQLPPVKIDDADEHKDFCFNSQAWQDLNLYTIILNDVKRQNDKRFIEALTNVRIDKTSAEDLKVFYERDYPGSYEPDKNILQIFGTNRDADAYNTKCFDEIQSQSYCYDAVDMLHQYSILDDSCTILKINENSEIKLNNYDAKCIQQFDKDCKAPKHLELKEGCRVMLLTNLDIKSGLVNGTCGTITMLTSASVAVEFDNGVKLSMQPFEFEYIKEGKTKVTRKQYPLRLAYGITIHKSQGMTFANLVVNFNRIFDYGQAYVALSRTKSLDGLIIKGFDHNKIRANEKVVNFYKNLINNKKCKIFDESSENATIEQAGGK
jgi:ATP-dependent DNA helicase PIF1